MLRATHRVKSFSVLERLEEERDGRKQRIKNNRTSKRKYRKYRYSWRSRDSPLDRKAQDNSPARLTIKKKYLASCF